MAAQPTDIPGWASSGVDNVEPTTGEKTAGFQGNEKPPAQYFNWFWEIVSRWITYLRDGVLLREALDDDSPVLTTCDQDGNARHYVGAEGYFMGPAIQINYYWAPVEGPAVDANLSLGDALYYADTSAAGTVDVDVDDNAPAGLNSPALKIISTASSTSAIGALVKGVDSADANELFRTTANACIVMEGRVAASRVTGAASRFFWGLSDVGGLAADASGLVSATAVSAMFVLDDQNSRFNAITGDGTTAAEAGTAQPNAAVDTWYTLRVEFHGANTPLGVDAGGPICRFFFDGALIHEVTTNVPLAAGKLGPVIGSFDDGSGAATNFWVGPIRLAYNYSLTHTVPA